MSGLRWTEDMLREHQARRAAEPRSLEPTRHSLGANPAGPLVLSEGASEDDHQAALLGWADAMVEVHPELECLTHVPNGGKRTKAQAARFKAMGVRRGFPDLILPVPRGRFGGLFIELKQPGGSLDADQDAWIKRLGRHGNCAVVCWSAEQARREILNYLALGVT